jgi:23S rRNA pseudouridine1911/1915/1917 synthase
VITIEAEHQGQRLDKVAPYYLDTLSRSGMTRLIGEGHVTQHRGSEKTIVSQASIRVKEGDVFEVTFPAPEPTGMRPYDLPLDILYEDDDLLVVNKPAGLTVHPGAGNHQDTLANALISHCGNSLSGPE